MVLELVTPGYNEPIRKTLQQIDEWMLRNPNGVIMVKIVNKGHPLK